MISAELVKPRDDDDGTACLPYVCHKTTSGGVEAASLVMVMDSVNSDGRLHCALKIVLERIALEERYKFQFFSHTAPRLQDTSFAVRVLRCRAYT